MIRRGKVGAFAGAIAIAWPLVAAGQDALDEARRLWQTGKYDEAVDAYEAVRTVTPETDAPKRAAATRGKALALASLGKYGNAAAELKKLTEGPKPDTESLAILADLSFDRGAWDEAERLAKQAIALEPDQLRARFTLVELDLARGRKEPAVEQAKWFIDHHNANEPKLAKDPEALLLIGQAAEKYYRATAEGEDLSESLGEVLSTLYERAIQVDPRCWQAAWLQGRLFLSGYDEAKAQKELQRALRINPSAPEVLVTMGTADLQGYKLSAGRRRAEDALEINPHYVPARILLADLNISDERFDEAQKESQAALAENPRNEEALARLAASCRLLVDSQGAAVAEARALAQNPHPVAFYSALGERLADRRKYHSAERAHLLAIAADPKAAVPRLGLGMLYMQIGREDEANDLFETAFASDPFNVRADNMRKVLRHLAAYDAIETDHFIVKTQPGPDALVGRYMARYLEQVHDELAAKFGFTPPGRTQVEVMKDHQWFSGRTVALPFIPTVGACTGKVVALASPRATNKPYNWARVLVHEMTHVWNLQQSDFNIPHWYTEALAVESEKSPRPQAWNKMLRERVPARKLLNLETINLGFIRPKEPEERQLAYCQAQLYAQYMTKRFGPEAQLKLLLAFRQGLTTPAAVKHAFQVEVPDFEAKYLEYLDEVVKSLKTRAESEETLSFSELERRLADKPDDPDLNARMAYEHFARRDLQSARPLADKALAAKPNHPLGSYVKARLLDSIGDQTAALALLEPALDPKHPDERVLDLTAELVMKAGRFDDAEKLYRMGNEFDPQNSKWIAGLARVHLRQGDRKKLRADLALLAANDADDLAVRTTLASDHFKAGEFADAERWATECIYIKVDDPAPHIVLADALAAQDKHEPATAEYQVALDLEPKSPNDLRVRLARSLQSLGRSEDARREVEKVLQEEADHAEAKALRDSLSGR